MLIYLAHPVSPIESTESVLSNLAAAERWLVLLQRANPRHAIIAPWIQEIRLGIGREDVPEDRAAGLDRCYITAGRCDGIALCGSSIRLGMFGEMRSCANREKRITVHRFRSIDQDPVLPRWPTLADMASVARPWIADIWYGAVPESANATAAEIDAAAERFAP